MKKYQTPIVIALLAALSPAATAKPQDKAAVSSADSAKGFEVDEVRPGSLFQKLGLEKGDLVQEINGQAVKNKEEAIEALNASHSVKVIKLKVLRDGKPKTLAVKMHQ